MHSRNKQTLITKQKPLSLLNRNKHYWLSPNWSIIAGTYSNSTGLKAADECTDCTAGMYCSRTGLIEPVGECGPGFYCPTGTVDEQPAATICPVGHFCAGGNAVPTPCQNGSYVSSTRTIYYL